MTKNTLGDLNNHLFAQLERLSDEEIVGDKLLEEMQRAEAINKVATNIIQNGALVLKAKMAMNDSLNADINTPKMLEGK